MRASPTPVAHRRAIAVFRLGSLLILATTFHGCGRPPGLLDRAAVLARSMPEKHRQQASWHVAMGFAGAGLADDALEVVGSVVQRDRQRKLIVALARHGGCEQALGFIARVVARPVRAASLRRTVLEVCSRPPCA